MAQYDKEIEEIAEWLLHPSELGRIPKRIEFVKEFTDKDGINCKIFRYKTGMFSPWLMAIHSDSGIFSEKEKYNEADDISQATKMLETLKQYWKKVAENAQKKDNRESRAAHYLAFALNRERKFDANEFQNRLEADWNVSLEERKRNAGNNKKTENIHYYTSDSGVDLFLQYVDSPIPGNEVVDNAMNNYLWPQGPVVVASHTSHVIIRVTGGNNMIERANFYSMVVSTLCKNPNCIGLYTNGVVYEPKMVVDACEILKKKELPILILAWVGERREGESESSWTDGNSVWTNGMGHFGMDEMEIVGSHIKPMDLQKIMFLMIDYCIKRNISFQDGEEIGLSQSVHIKVSRTKGFNINQNKETLKITVL